MNLIFKSWGLGICHHLFWRGIRTCTEANEPLVTGLSDKWPEERGCEVDGECAPLASLLRVSVPGCPCRFPKMRIQRSCQLGPPCPLNSTRNSYSFHCYPHPQKSRCRIQTQSQKEIDSHAIFSYVVSSGFQRSQGMWPSALLLSRLSVLWGNRSFFPWSPA